jgi:hypothetical protein
MSVNRKLDPYRRPTPYEILGLKDGLSATAREIGKAYNDERRKAISIKDTAQRAQRLAELDQARDEVLRPDDKVLLDFFALSNTLFVDLCLHYSNTLTREPLPQTSDLLGGLRHERSYDDLVPADLNSFAQPFELTETPKFYQEPSETARLPLTELES